MKGGDFMGSAIVVTGGEKSRVFFDEILSEAAYRNIVTVSNAGEARRECINHEFDLCIINTPLTDEFGINVAMSIAENYQTTVILFVKSEHFEEISEKAEGSGIITLQKPINKSLFWSTLKVANAMQRKIERIGSENRKLLQKIEDIKLTDRAKCLLISFLKMTENEAHKYIEKQAMDMRVSKRVIAEEVIKIYEN